MIKTENPSAKPIASRRDLKSFFDDNGFVVIPDVLNASELAELRKYIVAAMDG
jgi:hypothetical protein